MESYPPDMTSVETITDDELMGEFCRRIQARNGAFVCVYVQDVPKEPSKSQPFLVAGGGIIANMGLIQWAGAHFARAAITGKLG